jgi:tripartite-type tricarboxylate transporter receptor subunit TctC
MCRAALGLLPVLAAGPATACERDVVTVVVPYAPGGSMDAVARLFADAATRATGKSFVVQHIGGASGAIGARHVARSAGDGCTVLAGNLNVAVLAPLHQPQAGYRPEDLVPVAKIGTTEMLIVTTPALQVRRLEDLPAFVRQRPTGLAVGHPGAETAQYLALPMIERQLGLRFVHVPYKGAGPMVNDLLAGHLDIAVAAAPAVRRLIDQGRLVMLAPARDWLTQRGEPVIDSWAGWFVPASVNERTREWLQQVLAGVIDRPEVRAALIALDSALPSAAEQARFSAEVKASVAAVRARLPRAARPEAR